MLNTVQFIAAHNDRAASVEVLHALARANFRQSLRAIEYANQARAEGDYITGKWFDVEAEKYAEKSDDSFAAALAAARVL